MAILLNIETSTSTGSVCLSSGKKILAEVNGSEPFAHARETTLMIDQCLNEAGLTLSQINAVAVSHGPGSYTSLRIGASVAKGICYALEKPLMAIDTLTTLAMAAAETEKGDIYVPMIDARRMEVYTAFYDAELNCIREKQSLILDDQTFKNYLDQGKRIVLAGNGSQKVKKLINHPLLIHSETDCRARNLVPLANQSFEAQKFESVAYFQPEYLKPPNITTPKKVL